MMIPDVVRLPIDLDAPAMAEEVAGFPDDAWVPHFNRDIYEGDWRGIALRAAAGSSTQLYPDPTAQSFTDTDLLGRCPVLADVLARFRCPVMSARLLSLGPGGVIKEHSDYRLGWEDGEIRVHVPIVSSEEVEFLVGGRRVEMAVGDAWYLNLNLPHRVTNPSAADRVHLVVDCGVDDWLNELMASALGLD